ncbi:Fanconi anemia group G protein isoform X2 [Alligator mississippiensis]|uniref:Fanconi anemia group G protein isoform X2 n=1 Tax=Alligator mississippiensis TaxID=8496 RepID=UPI00287727DF|nr:Fanconi anemia group G protein isoform X2 [Alligator mississippiensis]
MPVSTCPHEGVCVHVPVASSSGPGRAAKQAALQHRRAFEKLLQKMQGLPAVLPTLPLELTVLYNALLFDLGSSDCIVEGEAEGIRQGLLRVLEAGGVSGPDLSTEELWQKVLQELPAEELRAPLHRLGVLQGVLWLAANRLGSIAGLLRFLSGAKDPVLSPCPGGENELLALLRAWQVPADEDTSPLVVQSAWDVREVLWTAAAFLQGLQELEAGNLPAALSLLQVAATGFCSKRVLAQIYICLGCCTQQMGKPQTALQHLKQALQLDFQCLAALSQAAMVYHQLGETDAELEALALLHEALDSPPPEAGSAAPGSLVRTELLVHPPALASLLRQPSPSEVKYLLAQRCFQAGRTAEAGEHYLDLLAVLQEGPRHQGQGPWPALGTQKHQSKGANALKGSAVGREEKGAPHRAHGPGALAVSRGDAKVPLHGQSALPRIPEVFLEAASALEQLGRHRDAIAVCEEVVNRMGDLTPETLRIDLSSWDGAEAGSPSPRPRSGLPRDILPQKKESLRCILWRAAAYLHQGWAWAGLADSKEAITQFTRCLNDLLRVQLVSADGLHVGEVAAGALPEAAVLQRIRLLALVGRGAQFLELGRDRDALMNFQYALQVSPGDLAAASHLLQTLWKLDRRQEAAVLWQKLQADSGQTEGQQEDQGRSFPLYLTLCPQPANLLLDGSLARGLQDYLRSSGQEP